MSVVLVTGSSGLVGSACVRHFAALGWRVVGMDNHARRQFFGSDGDTTKTVGRLLADCDFALYDLDVRDPIATAGLVKKFAPDLVIHCAAQPSHDWAGANPIYDFEVNARGTINVLEAVRHHAHDAVFVHLSTNKAYGDAVNRLPLVELPTRYDYDPSTPHARHGIGEWMGIDFTQHSLFGCSKAAADLYVQEYGRYFGLRTACLRCGCLTGGDHAGAEQHGFLAYLARCCREGRPYTVHGYGGKQVRDNLHASDVARAAEAIYHHPGKGEAYNLGGGRDNSCSVLEAIAAVEDRCGRRLAVEFSETPRLGDHCVWYSDNRKFTNQYPGWSVTVPLSDIYDELCGVVPVEAS